MNNVYCAPSPKLQLHQTSTATNYRWSEGLITHESYGMTISSLDDLTNKAHIKKLVKYAIKDGTREVFNEFLKWVSLLKIKVPEGDLICKSTKIHSKLRGYQQEVKKSLERREFFDIEQYIKPIWKFTISHQRSSFNQSNEENLCNWFASDMKTRFEYRIKCNKAPKLHLSEIKEKLQKFVAPLNLETTIGYQKKRIFIDLGARKVKWLLGEDLATNEVIPKRKSTGEENKKKKKPRGNPKSEQEMLSKKISTSEAPPFLLSAILDFKTFCSTSEAESSLNSSLKPADVLVKHMENNPNHENSNSETSHKINPFLLNIEASFDLEELIDSVSEFSDDYSYSGRVLAGYIKGGNSTFLTPNNKTEFSYFLNMNDSDTFEAFQHAFLQAACKLYKDKS